MLGCSQPLALVAVRKLLLLCVSLFNMDAYSAIAADWPMWCQIFQMLRRCAEGGHELASYIYTRVCSEASSEQEQVGLVALVFDGNMEFFRQFEADACRLEARQIARSLLGQIYFGIADNEAVMSEAERNMVVSVPSTEIVPSRGMMTVYVRDPFDNRYISFEVLGEMCPASLAGFLGVGCTFSNVLVYADLRDTLPSSVLCPYGELSSIEELAGNRDLVLGFPELPGQVHDSVFRSARHIELRRGGGDDPDLAEYLVSCYHSMRNSMGRQSRRMRVLVHSPVEEGSRPVTLSVDTSARLSWLHERAVEIYGLPRELAGRVQLRRLRGNGVLPPHGALRSCGYVPRLRVELYMCGVFGGGKRKLADGEGDPSAAPSTSSAPASPAPASSAPASSAHSAPLVVPRLKQVAAELKELRTYCAAHGFDATAGDSAFKPMLTKLLLAAVDGDPVAKKWASRIADGADTEAERIGVLKSYLSDGDSTAGGTEQADGTNASPPHPSAAWTGGPKGWFLS
jgi:hypothetical protein